ncbi:MAG: hypothetical protein Q8J88_16360 [Bacteroidales bacterium]|nr:hypothetical protein [Bacteroidales bacterium]
MKTKSQNQNLLTEHKENEEKPNASGFPKNENPESEDVFIMPLESELMADSFSSQIDPFDKISPENSDIDKSNPENSDINLSTSNEKTEAWKKAVRKEYERNKPIE